jgi:hypothetical protein
MKIISFKFFSIITICLLTTSCASIVSGTKQNISVQTIGKGKSINGAQCTLINPKGTYFVTTPGSVQVGKAYDPLNIKCEKEGFESGEVIAASTTGSAAAGNLLFLGLGTLIGGAIDAGTGAAYNYADLITVILGEKQTIDNEGKKINIPSKEDNSNQPLTPLNSQPLKQNVTRQVPTQNVTSNKSPTNQLSNQKPVSVEQSSPQPQSLPPINKNKPNPIKSDSLL